MTGFTPGRNQDAAPTILGFRYQIQLTALRWLDLPAEETLLLECGEDIDRVLQASDPAALQRELEQIKVRGRSITLRSAEVLSALANFAAHLKKNPGISLRFRFTTTAMPGREKLSPFGKGVKGIDAWRELQSKSRWSADDDQTVLRIVRFIQGASCPEDCPDEAWFALLEIAVGRGTVSFADFLMRFEWSCGSPAAENLDGSILERLAKLPGDTGPDDLAREQRHNQLIAGLLEFLSQSGEKKLTKNMLDRLLARPTLSQHDRARLKLLEDRSTSQDAAIAALKAVIQDSGLVKAIPLLFGEMAKHAHAMDLSPVLPGAPPLVVNLAKRSVTVDALAAKTASTSWLNLHGDFGTGKSHLSFLIAERHKGVTLGVSMRGLSASAAETGLVALVATRELFKALLEAPPGVVMIDDLPEFDAHGRFATLLASFAKLVLSAGRSIISTSHRALPDSVSGAIGSRFIAEETPPFSDSDAKELFTVHQVKDDLVTPNRVSILNAMCRGHPMLLTGLARHLVARGTEPDKALVEVFLANKHRTTIDLETARAVLGTVEALTCRQLLYRLASAHIGLTEDEIRAVAAIDPPLPEPTACIARLDGLWLRRDASGRYEVSPLATPLWKEVPQDTNKSVHGKLADIIFARRHLRPSEFMRAISSLLIAGETAIAAFRLLQGCTAWSQKSAGYDALGVLLFFPPDQDHGLKPFIELPLRAAQIVTAAIEGRDAGPYIARIASAIQAPSGQTAMGAIMAGSLILTSSLSIPTRIAILGASLIERFHDFPGLPEEMRRGRAPYPEGAHLMVATSAIHQWDDLDEFLEMLATLPEKRRQQVVANPDFREGIQATAWRPLFDANLGLTKDAFVRLGAIEKRAKELGIDIMEVYATAGRLVILCEYEKKVDAMLAEADRSRARWQGKPAALAILDATVGQQLFLADRPAEGLKHLSKGLADPTHIVGLERANRLVDALSAAWESGEDPGPFTDALTVMLATETFAVAEVVCQMHSQIALVRWRQGRKTEAFSHFESATVRFLELEDCTRTRQLGTGIAAALMHSVTSLETGKPPPAAADGSRYVEPTPSFFTGTNKGMAGMWKARQGPAMLRWMVGRLARLLELRDAAESWTDRALEAALESKVPALLVMLTPRAIAAAIRKGAWPDAIESAIIHGRARVCVEDEKNEGAKVIEDSVQFEPLEQPGTRATRERAETWSLWLLSHALAPGLAGRVLKTEDKDRVSISVLADKLTALGDLSVVAFGWQSMASVIRLSVAVTVTDQQHKDALAESDQRATGAARFLAHALLSLRSDVRLGQAAISQAGTLQRLSAQLRTFEIPLDEYAQAVCEFWTMALERSAFQFGSPREFTRALAEAPAAPPLSRAKFLLRAALSAFSVPVPEETRTWLAASSPQA